MRVLDHRVMRLPAALHREGMARALLTNAASLMGTTIVTAGLGYVYWAIAARRFEPATVGFVAAVVSALTFLSMFGKMGLGTLLIGELPRHPGHERRLIGGALAVAGVAGVIFGALGALVGGAWSPDLRPLSATPLAVGLFAAAVGVSALALVFDEALIGLLRGTLQLVRNVAFAIAKIGALVVLALVAAHPPATTVYLTWPIGTVVSLAVVGLLLRGRLVPARSRVAAIDATSDEVATSDAVPSKTPPSAASLARPTLLHHALTFLGQAPSLAMPIVVTIVLSASTNAFFYVAYTIASFITAVSSALTTALYATGARDQSSLPQQLRLSLGLALGASVAGVLGVLLFGDLALSVFGSEYAESAGPALLILALTAIPFAIKTHFGARARIRRELGRAAALYAVAMVLEVAAAVAGARLGGLLGLAAAWLAVLSVEALLFAVPLIHDLRTRRPDR